MLWIGRQVSTEHLVHLFDADSVDALSSTVRYSMVCPRDKYSKDLTLQTPIKPGSRLSEQITNILTVLEGRRGRRRVPFKIARQEMDGTEIEFSNMLVEDQNNDAMCYTDCEAFALLITRLGLIQVYCQISAMYTSSSMLRYVCPLRFLIDSLVTSFMFTQLTTNTPIGGGHFWNGWL